MSKATKAAESLNQEQPMSERHDDPWTVLRLLDWTTDYFKCMGSESPRLDAEVLLAHARDCARIDLYTAFAEEPGEEQRIAFREMVRRRGEGTPVAQLVGYREFYSLRFRVSDATLIPRPETEHLVIEAMDCVKQFPEERPIHIADIGTGSGAIAISLTRNCSAVEMTAVDVSEAALQIANWNAEKLEVMDRIQFVKSDLLGAVEQPQQFHIICSNPPYVSEAEYTELPPTVRDFEPRGALVSGPEGTEIIARLLEETPDRLHTGGRLIVELSPMIADACKALVQENASFDDLRFIKDLDGHRRILSVQRI